MIPHNGTRHRFRGVGELKVTSYLKISGFTSREKLSISETACRRRGLFRVSKKGVVLSLKLKLRKLSDLI